jgi:hypothetical protein
VSRVSEGGEGAGGVDVGGVGVVPDAQGVGWRQGTVGEAPDRRSREAAVQ